jgi:hypothetical protein
MKQAIAGVVSADVQEVTSMVVWPSIAAYAPGRLIGRMASLRWPDVYIFRLGHLLALLSIPLALALYFYRLKPRFGISFGQDPDNPDLPRRAFGIPFYGTCIRLTNRRVIELRNELYLHFFVRVLGIPIPFPRFRFAAEVRSIGLDQFDSIQLVRRSGQEWFDAGDLVFKNGNVEAFRLEGVSRPEAFRHTCLKAHAARVGVCKALAAEQEAVPA